MSKYILILIFFLAYEVAKSQDFKISAGGGFPDLIHVGGSYAITEVNELSMQIGSALGENTFLTPTLEHRLYYQKSKVFPDNNTWFFGQRITYFYSRSKEYNWHDGMLSFSIGRNCYLDENFGVSLDGGILFWVLKKKFSNLTRTEVIDDSSGNIPVILPNLRLQFFYMF